MRTDTIVKFSAVFWQW